MQGIRIVGGEAEVPVEAPGGELHVDEDEIMGKLANLTGETRTLDSTELQDRAWMVSDLKVCVKLPQAPALVDMMSLEVHAELRGDRSTSSLKLLCRTARFECLARYLHCFYTGSQTATSLRGRYPGQLSEKTCKTAACSLPLTSCDYTLLPTSWYM